MSFQLTFNRFIESQDISLIEIAESRRLAALAKLSPSAKVEFGQFMTPAVIAQFMAGRFLSSTKTEVSLLDPGAGVGSLTAAVIDRICLEPNPPKRISIAAFEIDPELTPYLQLTMDDCLRKANSIGIQLSYQIMQQDFIEHAVQVLDARNSNEHLLYSHIIVNPPYRKITSDSKHRKFLRQAGIETSNLYAAFIALSIKLLSRKGEIVAITPRSFCNGPYFFPFRKLFFSNMSLQQFHTFEARDIAFRDDNVLQENVIFHAVKEGQKQEVNLSCSEGVDFYNIQSRNVLFTEILHPGDSKLIIHIPNKENDAEIIHQINALPASLYDLDIVVAIYSPEITSSNLVGFENHLNVFHTHGHGLPLILARGLAIYLASSIVDRFFRLFNGHTQVNATDLRILRYPSREKLAKLGMRMATHDLPHQEIIDQWVTEVVFT